jgi:serine/threonine protein kinase
LYREINLHNGLKHKHIVEMKKCFEDDKKIYIVLEYCPNGVGGCQW